jgi:ABC-type Fe3+/spermidine/putrescine transport system ATPase subunit
VNDELRIVNGELIHNSRFGLHNSKFFVTQLFLEIRDVSKRFGETTAVSHLSLTIDEGEIVCLLGPSGCGKTTLLRLIAGLEQPDSGEVFLNGRNLTPIPPHERGLGMMFQDFALFPHKNVFGNVAFGLQMRGDGSQQVQARVEEMLALVDLTGLAEREIEQLSGGEQQRVALARALAPGPPLLMLDEPLGALDRALRERLMVEVRDILQRVGVTAVYVTHDQTEAFAIAGRIVVMNKGEIEQVGPPQAIYERPQTPFVARFLGFHNLLAGVVVAENEVETGIGCLPLGPPLPPIGTQVTVLIKPDASTFGEGHGIEMTGQVTAVSFRGRYYQVWLQVGRETLLLEFTQPPPATVGDKLQFRLRPEQILLYEERAINNGVNLR